MLYGQKRLKDIYEKAFADASIPVPDLRWPVTIKNATSVDNTQLHFILHYSSEERESHAHMNLLQIL